MPMPKHLRTTLKIDKWPRAPLSAALLHRVEDRVLKASCKRLRGNRQELANWESFLVRGSF